MTAMAPRLAPAAAVAIGDAGESVRALSIAQTLEPVWATHGAVVRWILALGLLGATAAVFLVGALYAAMDRNAHFAIAPALFQWDDAAHAAIAALREDRLKPISADSTVAKDEVRIEQLSASGAGIRPFTHVTAYLAEVPDAAGAASPPGVAASAGLPPEILYGGSPAQARSDASRPPASASTEQTHDVQPLGFAVNVSVIPESGTRKTPQLRVIVAKHNDSLAAILQALGAQTDAASDAQALWAQSNGGQVFSGGEKISVTEGGDAGQTRPTEISVARDMTPSGPGASTAAPATAPWTVALADDGHYAQRASLDAKADDSSSANANQAQASADLQATSDESVQDSLYALGESHNLDRSLIDELVRLAGHDFDLESPVSATDKIDFLFGSDNGEQPQLRFVRLTAGNKTHQYYRFTAPDDGSVDYYDQSGRSVTKFLLRKPVPGGRLNDGFGWRIHPILKERRFHEGVDYDAPLGSPIEAGGAGVVEKIDQETGYGKYIRVRHDLGYETTYAHVAGYPRGIKVGSRVRQGEVIAFVGSTGYSTGSHLYYEVKINGHNVDPLKIRLADGRILNGEVLANFQRDRERTEELIKASTVAAKGR